jgi:hypothetical protein
VRSLLICRASGFVQSSFANQSPNSAKVVLDRWIKGQKEPDLSRPEAIRRLVELGLKAKK